MQISQNVLTPMLDDVKRLMSEGFELPSGIRNANPGNLRPDKCFLWRGQIGKDQGGKLIFDTPKDGIRALTVTFMDTIARYNIKNLRDVAEYWVNDGDLVKAQYADYVASSTGVQSDVEFPFDALGWSAIRAVIGFENRRTFKGQEVWRYYDDFYIKRSVASALER